MSYSSVFPGFDKVPMDSADLNAMVENSRVAAEKADTVMPTIATYIFCAPLIRSPLSGTEPRRLRRYGPLQADGRCGGVGEAASHD